MKKIHLVLLICLIAFQTATAQQRFQLTETSIVKDTTGTEIPYALWSQLMTTGRFSIKPENPGKENTAFIIIRMSEDDYEKKMMTMPKPRESNYFKTGSKFASFKTSDINGNKINTKTLTNKIIVLNFWFINCPPCRKEIPELNKLVQQYNKDTSVVFIAIALDDKQSLQDFLKTIPFNYTIVDDGRYIADQYSIQAYPTNIIIDPEGKVYFHSSGLSSNTVLWLNKSIKELKQVMQKKMNP